MVPMLDPMLSDATLLFAISPALAGVVAALVGAMAMAIAGTLSELRRPRVASRLPATGVTRRASAPLAA
jgi:hypothetical protein